MKILFKVVIAFISIAMLNSCKEGQDNYKIGVIFPMSAGGQASGQSAYNALQMCAEEWNEKGGVLGKKIVFDLQDSKGNPKEGLSIATRMVSLGIKPNLIISAISGVTLNVQTVTEKNDVILMGIIGSSDFLKGNTLFSIRNFITSDVTCTALLNIVKEKFPNKRLHVAFSNTELGRNFSEVIQRKSKDYDISIADVFSFEENESNYRNEILKHHFDENDIVYVIGVDRPLGLFIKQLRQSGFNGTILGDINMINSSCVDVVGEYMTNMYYINVKQNKNDETAKYKALYGRDMDVLAVYCYNGLDLLLSFIQQNGELDNKYIMSNINGFDFNSKIGKIVVKDNELNYEHELIRID